MARTLRQHPKLFAEGFEQAEGAAFATEGRLYITGWRGAAVWRIDLDGAVELFARAGGPNGVAIHWNGEYYIADPGASRIARATPERGVYTVLEAVEGRELGTPSDLTFHPSGAIRS